MDRNIKEVNSCIENHCKWQDVGFINKDNIISTNLTFLWKDGNLKIVKVVNWGKIF